MSKTVRLSTTIDAEMLFKIDEKLLNIKNNSNSNVKNRKELIEFLTLFLGYIDEEDISNAKDAEIEKIIKKMYAKIPNKLN